MAEDSGSNKPSTVLVVLLVVAAGIVVFLVGGLWWFRRRHRRSRAREQEDIEHGERDADIQASAQQSIPLNSTRNSRTDRFEPTNPSTNILTHPESGSTELNRADYSPPSMMPGISRPSYDANTSNPNTEAHQQDLNEPFSLFRPGSQIRLLPQRNNIDTELSRLTPGPQIGMRVHETFDIDPIMP